MAKPIYLPQKSIDYFKTNKDTRTDVLYLPQGSADFVEMNKDVIKEMLDKSLEKQAEFYNSSMNITNKRRRWKFILKEETDINNVQIKNAMATYNEDEDTITMTTGFYRDIFNLFITMSDRFEHALWKTIVALEFCVSHELAHLYAGHCQLSNDRELSIFFRFSNGLSRPVYQMLEIDADAIACGRVADAVASNNIFTNGYLYYMYDNQEQFLTDSIKALCGLFYYLRSLGCDKHFIPYTNTHPPTFVRCFATGYSFIDHYTINYEDKRLLLTKNIFDYLADKKNTFCKILNVEPFTKTMSDIHIIIDYLDTLVKIWNNEIKGKIKKHRRLPLRDPALSIWK